ncbi:hypothetical protein R1flu_027065 [Riccia fluitans]|uniref:Uncharacterized protein n=1 Tax=Riccia fluitans TaxID=41844 RepID=A0ABD1XHS6_9MARC
MKIKKNGHLVEPLDPDVDAKSQKTPKKKQKGSKEPSRKRPRSEFDPKDLKEGNLPLAVETSRKGKGKVTEFSHRPDVDADVDVPAEDRRRLKIGRTASHLEMDPPPSTPTGQISEHHGRKNQRLASLEQDLAHAKLEEEKLKATIKALEKEKSEMNSRVALMERKDLYDLLEAKMEGFQIANHPRTIGGFENLNLIITKKWVEIPMLNLEEFEKCHADFPDFVRGHRTLQDEVDRIGIDACHQSLLHALKATAGTLPNSLAVFEYMRSIFDSYINPSANPNVQPLVKGLDADDFSVDKFFGLQDPTSPDDVQASPDFDEDLRTNQCLRLQAEVRNLGAEPQRVTRSTCVRLDYEPTILPDVPPTDNPTRLVTLDLSMDARKDPSSPPKSQIVPIPALVDLTQYASSPENEGSEDQGWPCKNDLTKADLESAISQGTHDPEAIFHVLKQVLWLIVPIDPALVMTGIMNVEQQQDGHSCGKHVLQMLAGAAMKESDGLDRCFREEGIRYIATLDQVRSFDVVFGMYLSGKSTGPPM